MRQTHPGWSVTARGWHNSTVSDYFLAVFLAAVFLAGPAFLVERFAVVAAFFVVFAAISLAP